MQAFDCKMCGHCCEGRGGIILAERDLARITAFMGLSAADFTREYAERRNGKLVIRAGTDGYCVFFKAGEGCGVHPGKPDVCRAWPFFRGNLTDSISLDLARDYCPGIGEVDFEEFRRQGLEYLKENGLLAGDEAGSPNALKL